MALSPREADYVGLSNSWIIIIGGGGPTDDKAAVTLETPRDPDRVISFLNIRVKDIEAVYAEWSARGAQFLTPPKQHQCEIRCYIRDPDGHLIEAGTEIPTSHFRQSHPSVHRGGPNGFTYHRMCYDSMYDTGGSFVRDNASRGRSRRPGLSGAPRYECL